LLNNNNDDNNSQKMTKFMRNFEGNAERLKKYSELLLLGNEASPVSYMNREGLRRICITLTTKCNLECVWCHRNETRFNNYLEKEMPFEMFQSIIQGLKDFKWLHIGGLGEPLMYKNIFQAIKEARQSIPNVKITTNSTLLTKGNCNKLVDSGLTYLEASIDGFDNITNKKMRGVSEDKLIENLHYLSDNSNLPIQINIVISNVNYESLFEAVDRLKDVRNIVLLHTIPLFMTKHMQSLGIGEITTEQHSALLLHWKKRISALNLKMNVWPDIYETQLDPVITMKRRHNQCFTVYEDPFINVFGYLSPCGRLQEMCLDNVLELGFDGAWNGPKMLSWRKQQLRGNYTKLCELECHMRNTCKV